MAGLSDADQGGFSLPRLDPGCSHCAGSCTVSRSCAAHSRAEAPGDSGMAELLLQVSDDGLGVVSGARFVYPVDEAEEYAAAHYGGGFDYASWAGVLRLRDR